MYTINKIFSETEMNTLFFNKVVVNPITTQNNPKYNTIWNYSNRLLLQTIEENQVFYLAFLNKDYQYMLIAFGNDFDLVIQKAKEIWNPKIEYKSIDTKSAALDMIEDTIMSILKRNKIETLKKSHCSYIYFGSDNKWHAYYPTNEVLIEFHKNKNPQSQQYIDFINSEQFATIRKQWDMEPCVIPGE